MKSEKQADSTRNSSHTVSEMQAPSVASSIASTQTALMVEISHVSDRKFKTTMHDFNFYLEIVRGVEMKLAKK